VPALSWPDRLRAAATPRSLASASLRSVASLGAIGIIILGAAPMAAARANPVADTILAQAIDGTSAPADRPAPPFSLTEQHSRAVSLASLRGKVVLLTFLDPVCTSDCPLEAQEFRQARPAAGGQRAARRAGRDRGQRDRRTRGTPAAGAGRCARSVAGHLPGHRRRNMGRSRDGWIRRGAQQLLAVAHPPARRICS